MAYRYGDRRQTQLFPQSLEDYVGEDDPVRAYDAFVESIDLAELGVALDTNKVGCPEYDPQAMLKLLVYGYSYGIRSSRKLERAVYHNLSFIWLTGGLKPDHKTIAEFRRRHKGALTNVLKQCVRLCMKLDLIEGNTLFVDGSKIRANASIKNAWTQKRCTRYLEKVDAHIESILTECDRIDDRENDSPSLVQLQDELKNKQTLKARIESIQQELKESGARSVNTTDPDCVKVKGRQGVHAGYNGQIVVDEKYGLIASSDVVSESNDQKQFAHQIEQGHKTLGHGQHTTDLQHACAPAAQQRQLRRLPLHQHRG
ncbi:MAG: transposase, partial [Nitrospinae bacterium]|nr:transposase [Nitrospinota bacterium]